MVLKHPTYAHGISDAELIKEALDFCDNELDSFDGMEYDSDTEVCCQRSNTFIRELVRRLSPQPAAVQEPVAVPTSEFERHAEYLETMADVIMDSPLAGKLEAKLAMERAAKFLRSALLASPPSEPAPQVVEAEHIAKLLWERFAPEHEVDWPSPHAAEYRSAAKDILASFASQEGSDATGN